jgi:hypothetical protein
MLDPRVGRWLSIDPKVHGTPWESPYSSMANNPLWYNDILGDKVEYKSNDDQKRVEKYTNKTYTNKRGKVKENKSYNEEFAKIIEELDAKEETYVIGARDFGDSKKDGLFSYDGNKFYIEFSLNPSDKYGFGASGAMFEEVYHAKQFIDGKVGFEKQGSLWGAVGLDAVDEFEAKEFALKSGDYRTKYNDGGFEVFTQAGYLLQLTRSEGIDYLVNGRVQRGAFVKQANGTYLSRDYTHMPSYPGLSKKEVNSTLQIRTFSKKTVGYPNASTP